MKFLDITKNLDYLNSTTCIVMTVADSDTKLNYLELSVVYGLENTHYYGVKILFTYVALGMYYQRNICSYNFRKHLVT